MLTIFLVPSEVNSGGSSNDNFQPKTSHDRGNFFGKIK